MKKPDRGPDYRWNNGAVTLREIKRPDLVKDPYRVRGTYTKEDGRPGTFDAMNWREARAKAEEINKALEEGRAARSKTPTFARVWKEWSAMRQEDDLSPATRSGDRSAGNYILPQFGKKPIDDILSYDLERWLKALAKSRPGAVREIRSRMMQVFRFARRKKYLMFNPLLEDPITLAPRDLERPWVPTWEVIDQAIAAGQGMRPADNPHGGYSRIAWSNINAAIALGAGAGLRIGETVALTWGRRPGDEHPCVDFANRVIHVNWALTSRGITRPKKNKIRDVPMTQLVYDALFEHMHVLQTIIGKGLEGPVLYNRLSPGKPTSRGAWNRALMRLLVHAGIIPSKDAFGHWRYHVLRRFYISARFALGHRELDIREAVAHSGLDVTFKHYARALPEPPGIWRYRFRLAEPDDQPRVIDGDPGVVIVDGIAQLPAPAIDESVPDWAEWALEARRHLDNGEELAKVCAIVGRTRHRMAQVFRKLGWPAPIAIYRAARDRRFEQLSAQGVPPCDIATRTGASTAEFYHWRRTHEAGVPNTAKSLETLRKERREKASVATDTAQKQLALL